MLEKQSNHNQRIEAEAMARGGKRPGAGRKPNTPNKATQARQQEVADSGPTPLAAMLRKMRFHLEIAEQKLAKGEEPDADTLRAQHAALLERSSAELASDIGRLGQRVGSGK
jgi:hypothetical protein